MPQWVEEFEGVFDGGLSFQMHYVVRTSGEPEQLVSAIRDELRRIAPGVPMYPVRLRRGEIGLRMALGASGREARGLIVRDGLSLAAIGIVFGVAGAAGAGRVTAAMLFGVTPFDLPTMARPSSPSWSLRSEHAWFRPSAAGVPPAVALGGE